MIRAASRLGALASGTVMMMIMIGVTLDVVVRAVRGRGFTGLFEATEPMLVVAVMAGLAFTQLRRGHVAVSFLVDRMSSRVAPVLQTCAALVGIVALTWLAVASWPIALESVATGEYRMGLSRIPLWPARIAVVAGAVLLAAQMVGDVMHWSSPPRRTGSAEVSEPGEGRGR